MYRPTAKGYFSGAGLMEIGIMQAGIDLRQSLDLDSESSYRLIGNGVPVPMGRWIGEEAMRYFN